jgi:2-dehydro-3-deoxy-D-arabinonate dehydratase
MHLVRYSAGPDAVPTGVATRDDDGTLRALPFPTMAAALQVRVEDLRSACADAKDPLPAGGRVLAPVDERTEVWASGVTYHRSRDARMEESNDADVYSRVYSADRPSCSSSR